MTPIGMVGHFQFALAIPPTLSAKNMAEFVAWLIANPTKANYGSHSPGSLPHFSDVMLGRAIGVDMVHVAYNGGAPKLSLPRCHFPSDAIKQNHSQSRETPCPNSA